MMISTEDQYRLAIKAKCHARTVKRWIEGGNVQRATEAMLVAAAKKLGIKLDEDDATDTEG